MCCMDRIMADLNRIEREYNLSAENNKWLVKADLRDLRLFYNTLGIPQRTDDEVIHLFAKFDFLFFCLNKKNLRHIHPLVILQYYDFRALL